MNAIFSAFRRPDNAGPSAAAIPPPRRKPRVRDFGIGYGRSSGYVNSRRYASSSVAARFRCA